MNVFLRLKWGLCEEVIRHLAAVRYLGYTYSMVGTFDGAFGKKH